jgi:hypothetical protein
VKDKVAELERARKRAAPTVDRQPQPCLQLGRAGSGQQHVVEMPVNVYLDEVRRGDDGHDGYGCCVSSQASTSPASCRKVGPSVDDRDVSAMMETVGAVAQWLVPNCLRE